MEMRKISVDIPKEHYDKLQKRIEGTTIKLTDIIRMLIKIYLE